MKRQKLKLSLDKLTISKLNEKEEEVIKGGGISKKPWCTLRSPCQQEVE